MTVRQFNKIFPEIHDSVYIDEAATVIGAVRIAADASVWPGAVIRGDVHRIDIGAASNIQDNAVLHVTHAGIYDPDGGPLTLAQGVTVGHAAVLHACSIGAYCLIGMGAVVLDHARVDSHCLIAAGSVVGPGKHLKSGELWMGNPARKARDLSDEEREKLEYSAQHYVRLKNRYLQATQESA